MTITSSQYNQRLLRQLKKRGFSARQLPNGSLVFRGGTGRRVAVLSGLHGDEKSGPLGILKWLEKSDFQPKTSFLIIPLVNGWGWDKDKRLWQKQDLNRSFGQNKLGFMNELGQLLLDFKPDIFFDFHQDVGPKNYFYRLAGEASPVYSFLKNSLGLSERKWSFCKKWQGSSEVFVREAGCERAVSIELSAEKKREESCQLVERILMHFIEGRQGELFFEGDLAKKV